MSSSVIHFSSCLQSFPSIRVFSNELALPIRWPKYWSFSFSISPSNEYSGLISFRIDWFDLLAVQSTLKSSPASQFEGINSSALSLFYCDDVFSSSSSLVAKSCLTLATPWTVACQAPLSLGFSRQEYSGFLNLSALFVFFVDWYYPNGGRRVAGSLICGRLH